MSKPDSNAPSNMLPWVRTTDVDIQSLQQELESLRVQLSKVGINVDTQLNSALSDAFDFEQQSESTYITKSRGMEFDGIVKANAGIVSRSALSVGDAAKVAYDGAGNPISDGFANFEVIPGVSGVNPGTGEQYFQPGTIIMNDSTLKAVVNGSLTGEGLDISLMSTTELPPVRTDILDVTSDGEYATYTIDGTGDNPTTFVTGAFVTIEGIDPVGYDLINVPIWDYRDDGATMIFTVACTEAGPYVSGGQAYVVTSRGEYESKFSVGAEDNGVTINRNGVYVGIDSGAAETATASVTSTSVNAPQIDVDSAVITNTRVFVSNLEPTAVSDGDIWIDPSGTPSIAAEWDAITGKPATFPPSTHNHDDRYYTETEIDTNNYTKTEVDTKLGRIAYAMAAGEVTITPVANTPTGVTVTLPSGRFSVAPLVTATGRVAVPGNQLVEVSINTPTATSVLIYVYRTNATSTPVVWHAIQMTSGSASG